MMDFLVLALHWQVLRPFVYRSNFANTFKTCFSSRIVLSRQLNQYNHLEVILSSRAWPTYLYSDVNRGILQPLLRVSLTAITRCFPRENFIVVHNYKSLFERDEKSNALHRVFPGTISNYGIIRIKGRESSARAINNAMIFRFLFAYMNYRNYANKIYTVLQIFGENKSLNSKVWDQKCLTYVQVHQKQFGKI